MKLRFHIHTSVEKLLIAYSSYNDIYFELYLSHNNLKDFYNIEISVLILLPSRLSFEISFTF